MIITVYPGAGAGNDVKRRRQSGIHFAGSLEEIVRDISKG